MRRRALRLVFILLAVGVGFAGVFVWGYGRFMRPGPLAAERTLIIAKGAGVKAIAGLLARGGVIEDPLIFRLGVRFSGFSKALRAGEYLFPTRISPKDAMALIVGGKTVVRKLTVPEGLTTDRIFSLIAKAPGLEGLPGPKPAEGTMLPETYHYSHGDSRAGVVRRMTDAMSETLNALWRSRAYGLPFKDREEAVIMASIIEKETALAGERAHIAGVFVNRLKRRMKLQSDPSVAYGMALEDGPLERPLTRADLKRPTPFNTYLHQGLPPAPIDNPGRLSIEAALNPMKTDDLYFVADGSGGHVFARTLKEHNRNVAKWRKLNDNK